MNPSTFKAIEDRFAAQDMRVQEQEEAKLKAGKGQVTVDKALLATIDAW